MTDDFYMKMALQEAKIAFDEGEVPIGAVIVCNGFVVAKSHNQTERLKDFTAHAEMLAFTSASNYLSNKYLKDCTLYVTLEPCSMCAGAAAWTQIGRIVYGATDPRKGFSLFQPPILSKKTKIDSGLLEKACLQLVQDFFASKR